MNKKIGRNLSCPCGSGKKYKKCHMDLDKIPSEVFQHFEKIKKRELSLREIGIYINYVNPILFNDKKVWALGNKVYARSNPNETFHDFIQFILKETLGNDWITEQLQLPVNDQHFLIRCFFEFDKWRDELLRKHKDVKINVYEGTPNGWVKTMLTLAFDIATLKHASNLPDFLIQRLRVPREYQGVRYEIMVAAIVARLGFTIEWLDLKDIAEPHCEFIATHTQSGTKIAIEAKSRHRAGVLHMPGASDKLSNYKGDVQGLLNKAYKKKEYGQMPFIIFIDVNAPFKHSEDFKNIPWIKDVLKKAKETEPISKENPSKYNALYFTNFSYHYQSNTEATPGQNLQALPQVALHEINDRSLYPGILNALHHYGNIPDINLNDSF